MSTEPQDRPQVIDPPGETVEAARGATFWAKSVSRLKVTEVPEDAIDLNVEGKRLASPVQGFGKMWHKTYRVRLDRSSVSPTDLIAIYGSSASPTSGPTRTASTSP